MEAGSIQTECRAEVHFGCVQRYVSPDFRFAQKLDGCLVGKIDGSGDLSSGTRNKVRLQEPHASASDTRNHLLSNLKPTRLFYTVLSVKTIPKFTWTY